MCLDPRRLLATAHEGDLAGGQWSEPLKPSSKDVDRWVWIIVTRGGGGAGRPGARSKTSV